MLYLTLSICWHLVQVRNCNLDLLSVLLHMLVLHWLQLLSDFKEFHFSYKGKNVESMIYPKERHQRMRKLNQHPSVKSNLKLIFLISMSSIKLTWMRSYIGSLKLMLRENGGFSRRISSFEQS